ncbi:hypothetical protein Cp87MAT_0737 [Corynebacterium pseudotuberculosis]|nr:hypothetical protein Cp87MAT_0737 [Corynebacterium pseudotuberculosis]QBG76954.1 Hypothetical protein CpCAP1R_0729 [Corynebacterium pseudotuberculosis]QBK60173.1 Hypothetical protein CpE7_0736 [Corynebacterium pseudotuberculosis]QBS29031.1 Hypothetical protein CpCAP1C_0735 [Corynebacterium pseudotuberculosis]QDL40593.1 Hypothetical protein CpOVID04_0738 [Corynebacterium pseudotuberculosis]
MPDTHRHQNGSERARQKQNSSPKAILFLALGRVNATLITLQTSQAPALSIKFCNSVTASALALAICGKHYQLVD